MAVVPTLMCRPRLPMEAVDLDDHDPPELHHLEEAGVCVRVEQQKHQKLHIRASAHLPLSRAQAFSLIMHPDNGKVSAAARRPPRRAGTLCTELDALEILQLRAT